MPDNLVEGGDILAGLSVEEQAVLHRSLKRVEMEVFHAVLRRISAFFAVVVALLTITGIIGFSSLWSGIETRAVDKMTNDPEMRDKVQKGILEKSLGLQKQSADLERENARAASMLVSDLEEIREMIKQVKDDILARRKSTTSDGGQDGGKK